MKLRSILVVISVIAVVATTVFMLWPQPAKPLLHGTAVLESDARSDQKRVDFLVQGEAIYIDQNGDNKPQAEERIDKGPQEAIHLTASKRRFQVSKSDLGVAANLVSGGLKQKLILYVDIGSDPVYTMSGKMELNGVHETKNWLRFGAPLQFLEMEKLSLQHSEAPSELKLFLGTVAFGDLGDNKNEDDKTAMDQQSLPPFRTTIVIPVEKAPFPRAKIEFAVDDSEPIIQELLMDQFC